MSEDKFGLKALLAKHDEKKRTDSAVKEDIAALGVTGDLAMKMTFAANELGRKLCPSCNNMVTLSSTCPKKPGKYHCDIV